ncbi:transposase [Candidatus Symbiobacter mobilis]|uniref:transposase n=1 Tax=Candidatus Symbiobacter mobilis TaxID=1436290 RepID=UPI001651879E|nr:transposase [Candidatus Symbiobacter mobilis]
MSHVYPSAKDRQHKTRGIEVRVIEYALEEIADAEPNYRLITNWLDEQEAPAEELTALHHQRWTIEQTFDGMKTHLAERAVTLRSKRPQLVLQELYALLIVHAAIRRMMTQAAAASAQAAQDLSFFIIRAC